MGFIQTTTDPCIYRSSREELAYLGVYVDDIIVATRTDKRLAQVKKDLASRFDQGSGKTPSLPWHEDFAG